MKYIDIILVFMFMTACNLNTETQEKANIQEVVPHQSFLKEGNWSLGVKHKLESIILENEHKGKKVIFDFDNTVICRDIGEATFETLTLEKTAVLGENIQKQTQNHLIDNLDLSIPEHLNQVYEKMLNLGVTKNDKEPYAMGYAWVVQIMEGLTIGDVIQATEKTYDLGVGFQDFHQENPSTKVVNYYKPFFYPEIVDLIGNLLTRGYDVHIVSASNVWTVRWMVQHQLNPMLKELFGDHVSIQGQNVIGVNTLLYDRETKEFVKDEFLVEENKDYLALNKTQLDRFEITNQLVYPIPAYHGKIANILKFTGSDVPVLVVGDSPNDLPMLKTAEYKLWITRLEKPKYQRAFKKQAVDDSWMMQPTLYKSSPGFIQLDSLENRLSKINEKIEESITLLGI